MGVTTTTTTVMVTTKAIGIAGMATARNILGDMSGEPSQVVVTQRLLLGADTTGMHTISATPDATTVQEPALLSALDVHPATILEFLLVKQALVMLLGPAQ